MTEKVPAIAGGVPAGGTTGQVLAKVSNTDNDVGWAAGAGGLTHISVDTTYQIGGATPDYANVGAFIAGMAEKIIDQGVTVTAQLRGNVTETAGVVWSHPQSSQIEFEIYVTAGIVDRTITLPYLVYTADLGNLATGHCGFYVPPGQTFRVRNTDGRALDSVRLGFLSTFSAVAGAVAIFSGVVETGRSFTPVIFKLQAPTGTVPEYGIIFYGSSSKNYNDAASPAPRLYIVASTGAVYGSGKTCIIFNSNIAVIAYSNISTEDMYWQVVDSQVNISFDPSYTHITASNSFLSIQHGAPSNAGQAKLNTLITLSQCTARIFCGSGTYLFGNAGSTDTLYLKMSYGSNVFFATDGGTTTLDMSAQAVSGTDSLVTLHHGSVLRVAVLSNNALDFIGGNAVSHIAFRGDTGSTVTVGYGTVTPTYTLIDDSNLTGTWNNDGIILS